MAVQKKRKSSRAVIINMRKGEDEWVGRLQKSLGMNRENARCMVIRISRQEMVQSKGGDNKVVQKSKQCGI